MLESTAISEPELLKLCIGVCNFILDKGNDKYFCNKSSCNNSCSHMKFRLHDHVIKNIKSPDNIKNFYEALKSISKNAKSKLKDCSIENYNMIENKFTNFKYLYEFYFNYMDISKNFFKGGDINAKLYCKYIKFFFRFYNTIKDNCSPQKKFKYCNILDELRKRFIIQGEITNVYEKCNYEETSCEEGTNVSTDIPCLTEKKNGSTVQKLGGDPNDNTIIKILLNFTPIGSLIRSRMNKRKNMLEHVYENNYDHLGNISKDEVPNSDSRDYNVLYQSDKNI
ncbi:hypothetical protein PVIIG_06536 [Plasmodium vivax India VII]|uniref:VIR protein n=1 Tax=Plasmodium vivax India VII TaxID=1077284 RepID=A0A0J9S3L5_PLAVI|nr:hypothetical protein PVIIG_06536 [Plasmodium vivax India VII]